MVAERQNSPGRLGAAAWVSGLLFGWGLALSGMIEPGKVIHFLDVTGRFDPTLACVLLAAVTVTALGYRLAGRQPSGPWFAPDYDLPRNRAVDLRLVAGAALFGAGWGLAGLCPAPALADLASGSYPVILFVASMLAGMKGAQLIGRRRVARDPECRFPA